MSYWGPDIDECDFAFDSIGANIFIIKERLFNDIETIKKGRYYSEQSMIANLACLRLIGEKFPKNLSVSFRKKDYLEVQNEFYNWYYSDANIPKEHKEKILIFAEKEFQLFEERILNIKKPK